MAHLVALDIEVLATGKLPEISKRTKYVCQPYTHLRLHYDHISIFHDTFSVLPLTHLCDHVFESSRRDCSIEWSHHRPAE